MFRRYRRVESPMRWSRLHKCFSRRRARRQISSTELSEETRVILQKPDVKEKMLKAGIPREIRGAG